MRPMTAAASAVLALLLGAAPSRAASVTTDDFVAILGDRKSVV